MNHYLLSVHAAAGEDCHAKPAEEMQAVFQRIQELEGDMREQGVLIGSGRLGAASDATVVREEGDEILTTDGPFVEAREHIAGFYILQATDLDAALGWARRTTHATGQPIEVRAFHGFEGR